MSDARRHSSVAATLLLTIGAAWGSAHGAATTIDDSATWVRKPLLSLQWTHWPARGQKSTEIIGTTVVNVHLNVSPWLHRRGRIYLLVPRQVPGTLRAEWSTQGRLQPGTVTCGSRSLVFSGVIDAVSIEDVLSLSITVDGRQLSQVQNISFQFEMESD